MSKYCNEYKLRVTYLDCLECETKECKRNKCCASMVEQERIQIAESIQNMEDVNLHRKGETNKMLVKRYLMLEPEQKVFLVFASKREGYKDNIIIRCNVRECSVRKNETIYYLEKERIVTKQKNIKSFIDVFKTKNANIDTGYRGLQKDIYPVFTSKEKCIQWLKG